jgi:D-apiose dehydrogenase
MNDNALRVGVIGAGYFSAFHFDAWSRMNDVHVVACCDLNLESITKISASYTRPDREPMKCFTDFRQMLDECELDFVDIITRPDTHFEIASAAADRGMAVLCQKPLAPSYSEAVQLVEKIEAAGGRMMVHENFRFQPWYRETKQIFDSGQVGNKLHTVSFRNRAGDGWGPDAYLARQPYFREMPQFLLFEAGIHTVDTFRFLAGEVRRVWCTARRLNPVIVGEDAAMAVFEFDSGAMGLYDANRFNESTAENPRYTFGEFSLEANGGTIRLAMDGRLTIQPLGQREQECTYQPSRHGFAGDCVFATQRHFVDRFRSRDAFETDGPSYLKSLRVQEAMYRSISSGTWETP